MDGVRHALVLAQLQRVEPQQRGHDQHAQELGDGEPAVGVVVATVKPRHCSYSSPYVSLHCRKRASTASTLAKRNAFLLNTPSIALRTSSTTHSPYALSRRSFSIFSPFSSS